jgi:hypothetical protein
MLIEFVQLVEQETRYQAEKLDLIQSGKHRELHHYGRNLVLTYLFYLPFRLLSCVLIL